MLLFMNILKQSLNKESTEIDSFEYQKLVDYIKANENDENIFKQACLIYITKLNYRISNLLIETYDDFLWFHIRLVIEDDNFRNLKQRKNLTSSTNYLTLKGLQEYVLESGGRIKNTNTYEPHLQYVKVRH